MKTIEDLKIERFTSKKEYDENGNPVTVPIKKLVPREVEVVKTGVRFGYYLIDVAVIYALAFAIGILSAVLGVAEIWVDPVLSRVIGFLIFATYYFFMEVTTGGTIGKLVLGYTVINQYAQKPSIGAFLGRSFARLVPFEGFSCLAERGWHDTWTKTYVVKKSERDSLQHLMGNTSFNEDLLDR